MAIFFCLFVFGLFFREIERRVKVSLLHRLLLFFFLFFFEFYFIYFFIQQVLMSSILYTSLYTCQPQSPNSSHPHPHPPLLSSLGVHTFVLYICVSISALQTSSSVPFFQVPHICVNIRYLFFCF